MDSIEAELSYGRIYSTEEQKIKTGKVTEQDLIKLGFKRKWFDDKSGYWFERRFKHKICGKISIEVITDRPWIGVILHINDEMFRKPLSHENLDLFIKFAKGEKL